MKYITTLLLGFFLTFCAREPTVLEEVHRRGELRAIVVAGPATYFEGPGGPAGLEQDLVSRFAEEIGVRPRFVVAPRAGEALAGLDGGRGDLVAAGMAVTPERRARVRFGPAYQETVVQAVYRQGRTRPRRIEDLIGQQVEVMAGALEANELARLRARHPELAWQERTATGRDELPGLVHEDLVDYTLATSQEVALLQRFYPELRVGFDVSPSLPVAWAFPHHTDDSLYVAAIHFFNRLRASGELAQIIERHFGHVGQFEYADVRGMLLHLAQRLPELRPTFETAARDTGFDWRLVAAVGYQESRWDPGAVSPTGVRGVMMLTRETARRVGVKRREDPEESIRGGARYLALMRESIPGEVPEPDRTWLALAAYNVGLGHLLDARRLTVAAGGSPDRWVDVKRHLPLLGKPQWYRKTRHGRARGWEPVDFVDSVRHYYDILVWHDEQGRPRTPTVPRPSPPPGIPPEWLLSVPAPAARAQPPPRLLPDEYPGTGGHPVEQREQVGVAHADAPARAGDPHRGLVRAAVDVDEAPEGVDLAQAVAAQLEPAEPQDPGQDPVPPGIQAGELGGVDLAGRAAGDKHRAGGGPGADPGAHVVPAAGGAAALPALAGPVRRGRHRVLGEEPAVPVVPQPLPGQADLQKDRGCLAQGAAPGTRLTATSPSYPRSGITRYPTTPGRATTTASQCRSGTRGRRLPAKVAGCADALSGSRTAPRVAMTSAAVRCAGALG
jgi:membrane-bound lytic murein transglycosylase F